MQRRSPQRSVQPQSPLSWLDWRYSLILPLAILLLAITIVVQSLNHEELLNITVVDQMSGSAVPGALVQVGEDAYLSDTDGEVHLTRPDSETTIRVTKDGYIGTTGVFGEDHGSDQSVALTPVEPVQGVVKDANGTPLQGVIVSSGNHTSVSRGDGTWQLQGAPESLTFSATGYQTLAVDTVTFRQDIVLQSTEIRAIYANSYSLASDEIMDTYIDIANTTEINAVVLDVKDVTVYYNSGVEFFRNAGSVQPIYDAAELLTRLKKHGIYTIARIVVFKDPIVADAYPELAVRYRNSSSLWRDQAGYAWVNPFQQQLWDANIALAEEAIDLGFDEIQYDYVRFPSEGDLGSADFGVEYTAENRVQAITSFVKQSSQAIHARGGKFGADLFGWVTMNDTEQGIGQQFAELEPYLDYINMMIYPTHFATGNIWSAPGHPNDYPYQTILESLERSEANVPGSSSKFRPWLQAFDYPGFPGTTLESVQLQIAAAEDFGSAGWMLWGNPYSISLYDLESET